MHRKITLTLITSALMSLSFATSAKCETEVFYCQSSIPADVEVLLCLEDSALTLKKFNFDDKISLSEFEHSTFEKGSYHRSLVDEHTLFLKSENNVKNLTFTEYNSAELGEDTREISIEIDIENKKQKITCNNKSFSRLSEIEDTIELYN
ncbi:hypothetical protein A3K86_21460 [Photobacterium jeanii]|uniref:C-type lysozyme inhibitor domain-containing protein n=1 Tax=Photobacterium jeanii TaxID=858640 RepID=A0A178K2I8_9GAMM|nr:hypothetical protein [Photobacterium jeanii]OAN11501.1 hypothetical protein A3K86_21460 [Photobacterium jeanii]PST91021.1 hypothetical protein C9I91_10565 [Photobacterium jeanii]